MSCGAIRKQKYTDSTLLEPIPQGIFGYSQSGKKQEICELFLGFGCNFPDWENATKTNIAIGLSVQVNPIKTRKLGF